MAALGIDAELRLVDRGEGEIAVAADRHRFGGGQEILRAVGEDSLLPGDERDLAGALDRDDAVIDLAREQPQREADHARRMGAHPLDRQVGLAGVGRAEDRPDNAVGRAWHSNNMAALRGSASADETETAS